MSLPKHEAIKPRKTNEVATIIAYAEKDRTGVLSGRSFSNPTFESICAPLMGLLGDKQAQMDTGDESASIDAEALAKQEKEREGGSAELLRNFKAHIDLVSDAKGLKAIGKEITPQIKAQMLPAHVAELREHYQTREASLSAGGAI